MNVYDKSISSSSTPNKPLSIPKGTYENEQSYQEKGLNVQNLKKPTPTKHFMSPTISAASKANPQRKKILAERNDSQDATHLQNTQKATRSLDSRTISGTEFGDNQENALIDDLSSRPYDPIINYLSPRPKFLRYKPNRRRETFLGTENEVKEDKNYDSLKPKKDVDLASSCGSLAPNSTETNVEQEKEDIDDTDEEFEELDEERGCWGLRGVLKVLFLMGVLVFSTLYISSMNSPTPSPVVQAVVCVKDGYHLIQDHVFRFVKNLDREKLFLVDREGKELGSVEERIEDVVDIEEAEIYDELNEVFEEIQSGEIKAAVDDFSEEGESEGMEIVEHEEKGTVEEEISDGSDIHIAKINIFPDLEIGKAEEFLDQGATDSELQGQEAVEEVLEMPLETESRVADAVEKENDEILDSEIGEPGDITDEAQVTEKESILRLVTGFSVFFSIVTLGFHLGKKRNARKDSDTILEPCVDTVIEAKCSSLLANKEDKHIEHPVSIVNSKSLMNSLEEDSKQAHESRAPTVELLVEIEVGEMSGTIRSCSRVIESEVSSHSVSMEKKGISIKANSICVQSQLAFSETSTMNCHSYTKKEEEMVTTTPLRRSSRLRNRVMSP